jgi:hypothetical protein
MQAKDDDYHKKTAVDDVCHALILIKGSAFAFVKVHHLSRRDRATA